MKTLKLASAGLLLLVIALGGAYWWGASGRSTAQDALDSVQQKAAAAAAAKGVKPKPVDAKTRKIHSDTVLAVASRPTKFRVVGHTVDIQALTLFMKTLEASPFIQNVRA